MHRAKHLKSPGDSSGGICRPPSLQVSQLINIRQGSTPSQAHSVQAPKDLTSHIRCSKKASHARKCTAQTLVLSKTSRRSRSQRHNIEREKLEKQEIHKKVEHDRRDLIKHWTHFLEELLPGALKSDPEVKAKNGKPNLPKKIVYQLACKYISTEQGREEDYKDKLRAQPSDRSSKCLQKVEGHTDKTEKDGISDHVRNHFATTPTASSETSPCTVRDLGLPASAWGSRIQERGAGSTTTADRTEPLSIKPSTGRRNALYSSINRGISSGNCFDDAWQRPLPRNR